MNIGIINKKQFTIGTGENQKVQTYHEMSLRPPHMESATYTISPNKKKQKENEPDFNIYFSFNRKNEKYRRAKVGAIWNKVSDSGVKYKSGELKSPAFPSGRLHFAVFEAKPLEGEDPSSITWTHDIIWSPPQTESERESNQNTNESSNTNYTTPPPETTIDIDEDEIPF
jgi:uncharacterized protein (DUF736 family)